jgi:hypothetical protein
MQDFKFQSGLKALLARVILFEFQIGELAAVIRCRPPASPPEIEASGARRWLSVRENGPQNDLTL